MIAHVYIHIPFCIKKCGYCSFYSEGFDGGLADKFINSLQDEIAFYSDRYQILPETIYFGGGTPSLLGSADIERILQRFDLSQVKEITLETNPATVTIHDLKEFRHIGINRLSIGAQSMIDRELELLGRIHKATDVLSLYDSGLGELFENISYDIIYGLPNQKVMDVKHSLRELLSLKPSHFSTYCLSLDDSVPLYNSIDYIPSDEILSEMYYLISDMMLEHSYEQYELSSFALDDNISQHNMCYWSSTYYLGLGAGACGYLDSFRYQNSELKDYLEGSCIKEKVELTPADVEKEYIITGLRKTEGISFTEYEKRFGCRFEEKYAATIRKMLEKGLIEVSNYIRLRPKYYFLSNEVLCEFL